MSQLKPIKRALISVYHKDGLEPILQRLHAGGVQFISTGGTRTFIEQLGYPCTGVEEITGYPSILGGRVKTLHPKVFGGILARRDHVDDSQHTAQFNIPDIDLVIVDLYPFAETVASGASEADIIEKIDIGGISLIRAAAKNFRDVVIVASKAQYPALSAILEEHGAESTLEERRALARDAFGVSSMYDSAIFEWFDHKEKHSDGIRLAMDGCMAMRYGENPHQKGKFYGRLDQVFDKLHGKELSYNNLLDVDAAMSLVAEFPVVDGVFVGILKHNNACGAALRDSVTQAWKDALASDPVSAFGGIIVTNALIDEAVAQEMDKIFFEVVIAQAYTADALRVLMQKKNRIILAIKEMPRAEERVRTCLNGLLVQQADLNTETPADLVSMSKKQVSEAQAQDLIFANILVKHCKSNAIVLVKNGMLLASGVGQTSRVDALKQAIEKARSFGHNLFGSVMASDAFFPFKDCVEIAAAAGVTAIIQPGGSIRDAESIEAADAANIAMVKTGTRHFRH